MIRIQTNITSADVTRASLVLITRPPLVLKAGLRWFVIVGAVMVYMYGVPGTGRDIAFMVFSDSVGALGSVAFEICAKLLGIRFLLKLSDGVLGMHEYELQDDGLFERTAVNETLTKWERIKGISRAGQYLAIELPQGAFYIFPRRSFANEDEQLAFHAEVSARLQCVV